jgi:hypothetical protein
MTRHIFGATTPEDLGHLHSVAGVRAPNPHTILTVLKYGSGHARGGGVSPQ